MKIKHLVIVGLILAIITIGAVSAADDSDALAIEDSDALAVDDVDVIAVDGEDPGDEPASEITADDFNVSITESFDLADYDSLEDADAITFDAPEAADGQILVNILKENDEDYSKYEEFDLYSSPITLDDLSIYSIGIYNVNVSYVPDEGDTLLLKSGTITVTKTLSQDDFYFNVGPDYESDEDAITSKYERLFYFEPRVEGTLSVYVNGEKRYNKTLEDDQEVSLNAVDLGIDANDTYNITFKFLSADNQEIDFDYHLVPVDVADWTELDDDYVDIFDELDILSHDDYVATVSDFSDEGGVSGTVTLFIDGKQYFTKTYTKYVDEEITVDELNIYNNFATGIHRVKLVYNKNNAREYVAEKNVEFYGNPDIDYVSEISVGEKENIVITFLKGTTGTVTAYYGVKKSSIDPEEDDYWDFGSVYKTVNIVDGVATITLDSLAKGENRLLFNISSSTYNSDERSVEVNVRENTAGVTSSVSASEITVGSDVVVKFNGIKSEEEKVYIYLDGKNIKSALPTTGALSETLSDLTVGQHKISVRFEEGEKFYSNTFYVTVKEKSTPVKKADKITLTLKKVKVKKSAKKLVLQATLKINGKNAKKGTKITFKFNNKKYTAKTNAKGVAKVTIKKSVLKKLKVGKKVKYQASYGKTTKKLSVKVKK
jgi:hypothetical protein